MNNQSAFPILKPQNKTNYSCAKLYFIQYTKRNAKSIKIEYMQFDYRFYDLYRDEISNYHLVDYSMSINKLYNLECSKDYLTENTKAWKFERRFNNCEINMKINFIFIFLGWKQLDGKLEFTISVLLIPIFSHVSILLNVLEISILSDKDIDANLYKYLKISFYFNFFYLFLFR